MWWGDCHMMMLSARCTKTHFYSGNMWNSDGTRRLYPLWATLTSIWQKTKLSRKPVRYFVTRFWIPVHIAMIRSEFRFWKSDIKHHNIHSFIHYWQNDKHDDMTHLINFVLQTLFLGLACPFVSGVEDHAFSCRQYRTGGLFVVTSEYETVW